MGVAVTHRPVVQKADEISRPAEVTPVALRAATSIVLSLALCERSTSTRHGTGGGASTAPLCLICHARAPARASGTERGRTDDKIRARVTSLFAARDDSPGRVVGGTE